MFIKDVLILILNIWYWFRPKRRGGATLCTRHAHSKYIIDNRMFTIQFKNGRWSENISLQKLNMNLFSCLNLFSIWDILNFMIAILVYKYCQQYLYKKKCTSIVIKLNSDYEFFSVLLWSFNEIVFLFKES
jgi:hypothetical protein